MAATPDTTSAIAKETEALDRAAKVIQNLQQWSKKYADTEEAIGVAATKRGKEIVERRAAMEKQLKTLKDTIEYHKELQKILEHDAKTSEHGRKEYAASKYALEELTAQYRDLASAAKDADAARAGGAAKRTIGQAIAGKLGFGGPGAEAKPGLASTIKAIPGASGLVSQVATAGLWGAAFAAAGKVAKLAAEQADGAIKSLVVTHERLTVGKIAGRASEFARAYAANSIAAIKWGVEVEKLNKTTIEFATRLGFTVDRAQKFTEFLARSSTLMGIDFADAAEHAQESIEKFGQSEDDLRLFMSTVQKVSKETGKVLGGMGSKGGSAAGVFAKDLFNAVREVSKEVDIFRGRGDLLVQTMGNMYMAAARLGKGYGQTLEMVKKLIKGITQFNETEAFFADQGARKRALLTPDQRKAIEAEQQKMLRGGKYTPDTLPESQKKRYQALQYKLSKDEAVRRAGIYGAELAGKSELHEGGEVGTNLIHERAKKLRAQFGVQGYEYAGFLKNKGIDGQDAIAAMEVIKKLAENPGAKLDAKDKGLAGKLGLFGGGNADAVAKANVLLKPLESIERLVGAGFAKVAELLLSIISLIPGGGADEARRIKAEKYQREADEADKRNKAGEGGKPTGPSVNRKVGVSEKVVSGPSKHSAGKSITVKTIAPDDQTPEPSYGSSTGLVKIPGAESKPGDSQVEIPSVPKPKAAPARRGKFNKKKPKAGDKSADATDVPTYTAPTITIGSASVPSPGTPHYPTPAAPVGGALADAVGAGGGAGHGRGGGTGGIIGNKNINVETKPAKVDDDGAIRLTTTYTIPNGAELVAKLTEVAKSGSSRKSGSTA